MSEWPQEGDEFSFEWFDWSILQNKNFYGQFTTKVVMQMIARTTNVKKLFRECENWEENVKTDSMGWQFSRLGER